MIKQNEAISHKNLLDEYNSAVKQKETFRNIEREQDVNQALNMEATASIRKITRGKSFSASSRMI